MRIEDRMPLPCGHVLQFKANGASGEDPELAHQKDEGVRDSYNRWFVTCQPQPRRVLEIGVCRGGSLALWNYLWRCPVVGIDCDLLQVDDVCFRHYELCCSEHFRLLQLNMPNAVISDKSWMGGEFDIIIDDGEHGTDSIISSMQLCWPLLSVGGYYIVEDWQHWWLHPELTMHYIRNYETVGLAKVTEFPSTIVLKKVKP